MFAVLFAGRVGRKMNYRSGTGAGNERIKRFFTLNRYFVLAVVLPAFKGV